MPHVFESLNLSEVIQELYRRGYGTDNRHGVALALNVAGTRIRKTDGKARREPIGAVSQRDLKEILGTSTSISHAADRVIAICTGKAPNAFEEISPKAVPLGPSPAEIDYKIQKGVEAGVTAALAALGIDKDALEVLQVRKAVTRRRPGRPKGSKNKPKNETS